MIYDEADEAIRIMNRQNLKAFGRLKLAKFDDLNLIRQVDKVYDGSAKEAKQKYRRIARDAFIEGLIMAHISREDTSDWADDVITNDWLLDMLEEVDPVTLYVFTTETERKKQRLIEALTAATDKGKEVDKALRYWTLQIGQYALNAVDRAVIDAFREAGVERVRWNTQADERVCETCDERNGKIYRIDKLPVKHYMCRCWITPVF